MVHRRTVVAIITLLTLVVFLSSYGTSQASVFWGDRTSRVKDECVAPSRLGGSPFSVTGDPDELATGGEEGTPGESLGAIGWFRVVNWNSPLGPGSSEVTSAAVSIVLCWLYVGEIGQID
ncbi:MAG: hypothetical protein JSW03_08780 [Candidatus Eiseniibacteriota bacterium]|nr:MAG: hypothetical protein JSW03_08780 [Candidatus Eisenbacteria bacterium]